MQELVHLLTILEWVTCSVSIAGVNTVAANTASAATITLPIGSTFTAGSDLLGIMTKFAASGVQYPVGGVTADVATGRARIDFTSEAARTDGIVVTFQYEVKGTNAI